MTRGDAVVRRGRADGIHTRAGEAGVVKFPQMAGAEVYLNRLAPDALFLAAYP